MTDFPDPITIARATPIEHKGEQVPVCEHCHVGIKLVPGGQGPTWVHDDGYVVCHLADLVADSRTPEGDADEYDEYDEDLSYELRRDK